jgi:hypothetical protein
MVTIQECRGAMHLAVKQIEDYINDNDGRGPCDNGCPDCTMGVVPDRFNTGLCGFHRMQSLLRKIDANQLPVL